MYGLLNAALREFVVSKHGEPVWDEIAQRAGVSIDQFNKMDPYPDALLYGLIAQTASVTRAPQDDVIEGFGEYWVEYTASQGYGPMFEIAGDSLHDFLLSLDELHVRVGRSFPKLVPPSFRFEPLTAQSLRMHYLSQRRGLCPMIPGLLRGLSTRFDTPIEVREDVCARRGAEHCEFVVTFPPKAAQQPTTK